MTSQALTPLPPGSDENRIPNLLTIAGVDPSGGAGVVADLKTFARHRCYGTAVVTALTAQNTRGVEAVLATPSEFVAAQLTSLLDDVRIDAVKLGMLGSVGIARVVGEALAGPLAGVPVVLDPVLVATSGDSLSDAGVLETIVEMLPLATLVTPNLPEAAALLGCHVATTDDEMTRQAHALIERGARAVLLKGGHLDVVAARDVLVADDGRDHWLVADRVETRNTHGTGCTLSSAIAARLGLGADLPTACADAKDWLTRALATSDELQVGGGSGHGPVNHFA